MMDSDHVSPDGTLRFLVRASGRDVTLGFDGFEWHTHGDILAAMSEGQTVASFWSSRTPESASESITKYAKQFVDDLLSGKLIIAITKVSGAIRDIWVTDDLAADVRYCSPDETIEFRLWDGTTVPVSSL
jgi:hypothetical protein